MSDDESTPVAVGDHVRPVTEEYAPGIYRVVGASERVALLRITDADDRRVYTGDLAVVAPATVETAFEAAENPDAGVDPVMEFQNVVSGMYWTVRDVFSR